MDLLLLNFALYRLHHILHLLETILNIIDCMWSQ